MKIVVEIMINVFILEIFIDFLLSVRYFIKYIKKIFVILEFIF